MTRLGRRSFWMSTVAAYWLCALLLLLLAEPIFIDGAGVTPSFYWGTPPSATHAEFDSSVRAWLPFMYPYWIAASMITLLGCVLSPWMVRRWNPRPSRLFVVSVAMTSALLLLLAAISDVGTALGIWSASRWMVWPWWRLFGIPKVIAPLSLLTGGLALSQNRVRFPDKLDACGSLSILVVILTLYFFWGVFGRASIYIFYAVLASWILFNLTRSRLELSA